MNPAPHIVKYYLKTYKDEDLYFIEYKIYYLKGGAG